MGEGKGRSCKDMGKACQAVDIGLDGWQGIVQIVRRTGWWQPGIRENVLKRSSLHPIGIDIKDRAELCCAIE